MLSSYPGIKDKTSTPNFFVLHDCILREFFDAMMLQTEENIQPNGCVTSWLVTVHKME